MQIKQWYSSPLGEMLLAADEKGLTGAWFAGQKYFGRGLEPDAVPGDSLVLCQAKAWLDLYFSGRQPDFLPPLHPAGTAFQRKVWESLLEIPWGKPVSYGCLAGTVARKLGKEHMSAQAVGGAVGRNPISVIIPCHRVVGADGSLTGYAGGMEKKRALLELEGADLVKLTGGFI